MPPRGSEAYWQALSRRQDYRPDQLAEDYLANQTAFNDRFLGQQAQLGDIQAQGIRDMGDAAARGIEGIASGYQKGKALKIQQEAHEQRMKLAEEDVAREKAEREFWDAPAEEGAPMSRREAKVKYELQRLKRDAEGESKEESWTMAGTDLSDGLPVLVNRKGEFKKGTMKIGPKPGAQAGLTPYQQIQVDLANQRLDEAKEAKKTKQDENIDKKVTKYSETLEKTNVPKAVSQLESVYSKLPPKGDVPGYGLVEGRFPDLAAGEKGRDLRQTVMALFNIELKDRSGAAVTDTELQRLKDEFGSGAWKTEDQLRKGIALYQARLKEVIRNIEAGVDPEASSEYIKRGGRDLKSWEGRKEPGSAPKTKLPPAGKVRVISPDGVPGSIPESQLEEALSKGFKRAD